MHKIIKEIGTLLGNQDYIIFCAKNFIDIFLLPTILPFYKS